MFNQRDVQRLSIASGMPELTDKNKIYPFLTKYERQKILLISECEEERRIAASIEIQRVWRGLRTRKLLFSILKPAPSEWSSSYLSTVYTASPTVSDIRMSLNPSRLSERINSSMSQVFSKIAMSYQRYAEEGHPKIDRKQMLTFQGFCAWSIQNWFREIMANRTPHAHTPRPKRHFTTLDAVVAVQRFWRRNVNIQVFKYYKDLINFRCQGDAKYMLRCINPKECDLLDSSSGVHVRFRLGGVKFPPTVYYKIFSHINVADVCSFAPRDYTKRKEVPSKFVHNVKLEGYIENNEQPEDWYQRIENNGWRPVTNRTLKYLSQDSIPYESNRKKIEYNHDKLQRRQDVERKKKKKKIEWMQKMYKAGILQTKGKQVQEVKELVDTAAMGVFQSVEQHGIEAVEDWEVDELLQWTNGLNFDSYLEDWHEYGTTQIKEIKKDTLEDEEEI
eukprot:TCONS_00006322-protein